MIHLSHYQDATEERAVSGLCGYPLCDAPIDAAARDKTQKYHISMKDNKVSFEILKQHVCLITDTKVFQVYDITERKNFCSNNCFKRSNFLKAQVSTSPLWLREKGDSGGDRPDPPKFYEESADSEG